MKYVLLSLLFSFQAFALYTEQDVIEEIESKVIPDYFTTQTLQGVDIMGTHYDTIIMYKERSGQIVARKGYVTRGTGNYQQIIYYQNGIGRNVYRIGYMNNINQFGTPYKRVAFFQNHIGKNLAIMGYTNERTFYQNGIFRNIAATDANNFLDGSLRPIAQSAFRELYQEFLDLVLDY